MKFFSTGRQTETDLVDPWRNFINQVFHGEIEDLNNGHTYSKVIRHSTEYLKRQN